VWVCVCVCVCVCVRARAHETVNSMSYGHVGQSGMAGKRRSDNRDST
jgi:hypothetical protein